MFKCAKCGGSTVFGRCSNRCDEIDDIDNNDSV